MFIKYNDGLEFGKYIVSLKISLSGQVQPTGGALLQLTIGNYNYLEEIPPIAFIGQGTVTGIGVLDEVKDGISGYYYSQQSVTIAYTKLVIMRIQ